MIYYSLVYKIGLQKKPGTISPGKNPEIFQLTVPRTWGKKWEENYGSVEFPLSEEKK